jgi:hypothetical protein
VGFVIPRPLLAEESLGLLFMDKNNHRLTGECLYELKGVTSCDYFKRQKHIQRFFNFSSLIYTYAESSHREVSE